MATAVSHYDTSCYSNSTHCFNQRKWQVFATITVYNNLESWTSNRSNLNLFRDLLLSDFSCSKTDVARNERTRPSACTSVRLCTVCGRMPQVEYVNKPRKNCVLFAQLALWLSGDHLYLFADSLDKCSDELIDKSISRSGKWVRLGLLGTKRRKLYIFGGIIYYNIIINRHFEFFDVSLTWASIWKFSYDDRFEAW